MDLNKLCLVPDASIQEAIEILNRAPVAGLPESVVLIQKETGKLLGIMTDGDLRRGISKGVQLTDPIESVMNKEPITFPDHLDRSTLFGQVMDSIQVSRKQGRFRNNRINTIVCTDSTERATKVYNFIDLWRNTQMQHRPICIMGTGFVGLTLAVTLVDCGYQVTGIDPSPLVHEALKERKAHFHEKGIDALIDRHLDKRLTVAKELTEAIGDVYIISVGTPVDENNVPSLTFLEEAALNVANVLKEGDLVVLRSTVPLGTSRDVVTPILEKGSGLKVGRDLRLSFAPERTVEGKALEELRSLPQIIGGIDDESTNLTASLFRLMSPTIVTVSSLEAAEMVKLVNNTYRDTCFAFVNELAHTCDSFQLDVHEVIKGANNGYPRNPIPLPSPGVGGICLKKDPYIYASAREKAGKSPSMALQARETNETYPGYLAEKIHRITNELGHGNDTAIFICGFAFKGIPETSDTRNSTTINFVDRLKELGLKNILAYDPVVEAEDLKIHKVTPSSLEEGFKASPIVCFMNNHPSWSKLNLFELTKNMPKPGLIFDTWSMFVREEINDIEGLRYASLSDPRS